MDEGLTVPQRQQVFAATAVLTLWHAGLLYYARRNPDFRERPLPALLYIALVLLLWTRLTIIHPAFYLMLFILFGIIFSIFKLRYGILVSLVLNGLLIYIQVYDNGVSFSLTNPFVLIYGVMAIATILFALDTLGAYLSLSCQGIVTCFSATPATLLLFVPGR